MNNSQRLTDRAEEAFRKGKHLLETNNHIHAMISLTEAIKCDDEHYESYFCRAEAFLQLEYHYMARQDAQKCIDLKPKSLQAYLKKGKIEYEAQAYKDARETYEKALDIDSKNSVLLSALQKTNNAERKQMFGEKRVLIQGAGVGTFFGAIFLIINEVLLKPQVIQGILMKGIIFCACAYLGYAAAKLYTDFLEQQRKLMLEPPKEPETDPFAGMPNTVPGGNASGTQPKKNR